MGGGENIGRERVGEAIEGWGEKQTGVGWRMECSYGARTQGFYHSRGDCDKTNRNETAASPSL